MKPIDLDSWKDAVSFPDWVKAQIRQGKTDTPAFKIYQRYFKETFAALWQEVEAEDKAATERPKE